MADDVTTDADIAALQALLDALPAPLEPLDVSMLDGYLVGVLLQPRAVAAERWLKRVHDIEGRAAPPGVDLAPLQALVTRRLRELGAAIAERRWFDPWVYELDDAQPSEMVLPWVAGFATAMDLFPGLMELADPALNEPLALLYAHLDPADVDDEALRTEIEMLEPASDLAEAVEGLVRSTLLLADVVAAAARTKIKPGPRRRERP